MIPNMIKERCDLTNNDIIGILSFTGDFEDDFVLSNPSVNDLFYNTLPLVFKVLFVLTRGYTSVLLLAFYLSEVQNG